MNRRDLIRAAGAASAAGLLGTGTAAANAEELAARKRGQKKVRVKARQKAGNRTHWILPGPRRLDPKLFGTPAAGPSTPQLGMDHVRHRIWALGRSGNPAAGLLSGAGGYPPFPVPVGWPEDLRATTDDGTAYTRTTLPLPFSDRAVGSDANPNVDGKLDLTYVDREGFEGDGDRGDEVDLDAWFTDPAGNRYEIEVEHLERHDGAHPHSRGVMTGAYFHGTTGIGTPLMPTLFAFGSFWGVASVRINGEAPVEQNRDRLVHFMTTQTVRTEDYTLAIDGDLPLGADGGPAPHLGQATHTHGILPPVKVTADGPRQVPLQSAFELPNGQRQPFAHFMWDEDVVQID
jgi:hypothetical protein